MPRGRPKADPLYDPPASDRQEDSVTTADFTQHAHRVFERLHNAMLSLIEAIPVPIRRATHLQHALELTPPLAWRVFKIAAVDDPLDVAKHLPGSGEIDVLLEAARKRKVPPEVISDVRSAMAGCAELVREHSGNRQSLRAMLESLRPNKQTTIDEKIRKGAYQSNALVWGYQVDTTLVCAIAAPQNAAGNMLAAIIKGSTGFHRLRSEDVRSIRMDTGLSNADNNIGVTSAGDLLSEFCSPGLNVRMRGETANRSLLTNVELPGLGRQAAVNYFHVFDGQRTVSDDDLTRLFCTVASPSAMLHFDLLRPASDGPRAVHARVFKPLALSGEQPGPVDVMPVEISAMSLGTITDMPAASGIPRYPEMVRKVLEHYGQYGMKFDLYRCRLAYPIMLSRVEMWVE